jgi:hypothetical protein
MAQGTPSAHRWGLVLAGLAGGWLSSCLDFDPCRWCTDAGADGGAAASCGVDNLWRVNLSTATHTLCQQLDGGFDETGGAVGSATCSVDGAGFVASVNFGVSFLDAGEVLCVHWNFFDENPPRGLNVELTCPSCDEDAGQVCGCHDQADDGCISNYSNNVLGPFEIYDYCHSPQVSLIYEDADGGAFSYSQGWVWVATSGRGCVWNDQECPVP